MNSNKDEKEHITPPRTLGERKEKMTAANCCIDGCDRKIHGRGLCNIHYYQAKIQHKLADFPRRNNKSGSPTYISWKNMIARCCNPNTINFANYGGRGITVCKEWANSFERFSQDMGERPKGMSIERKNNDKGYFLENCVWASTKEQSRNKRWNKNITHKGKTQCLQDWAEETGIKYTTLWMRLYHMDWPIEKSLEV